MFQSCVFHRIQYTVQLILKHFSSSCYLLIYFCLVLLSLINSPSRTLYFYYILFFFLLSILIFSVRRTSSGTTAATASSTSTLSISFLSKLLSDNQNNQHSNSNSYNPVNHTCLLLQTAYVISSRTSSTQQKRARLFQPHPPLLFFYRIK